MNLNGNIPTIFAQSVALASEIIVEPKPGKNHVDYNERVERLRAFQQMAIVVPFDECLIAFHGQELNEIQTEALQVIYKSTKPWMLGHVVGVLLNKLESSMANKDFAESVRTIVEQLTKDGSSGPTEQLKGMIVKMARQEESA